MSPLKHPRRVLSQAVQSACDLIDEPVQQPSNQVLNMLREMADWSLDHDPDREVDWPDLIHGLLVKLGYIPPRDLKVRWVTLLDRLSDYARWGEIGPAWDERALSETDWELMIRDELVGIAGRPM